MFYFIQPFFVLLFMMSFRLRHSYNIFTPPHADFWHIVKIPHPRVAFDSILDRFPQLEQAANNGFVFLFGQYDYSWHDSVYSSIRISSCPRTTISKKP